MQPFGDVDWGGHVVLVHDDEARRRSGLASWAMHGLDHGAKVVYVEPPVEPPERSLLGILARHRVDTDAAVERGQLEVVTAHGAPHDADWLARVVDEALAAGYPAVRWSIEATTAWGAMTPAAHTDAERAFDGLCRSRPVSALCQYPAGLPQAGLESVAALHGGGLVASQLRVTTSPQGVALAGAIDASNQRVARAALLAAAATLVGRRLVVDLSRLEFLDVEGSRAFLAGTTAHRLRHGTVCLKGVHGAAKRVLHLVGVDKAAGFSVETA
jgi:anti-anti-sigma factor